MSFKAKWNLADHYDFDILIFFYQQGAADIDVELLGLEGKDALLAPMRSERIDLDDGLIHTFNEQNLALESIFFNRGRRDYHTTGLEKPRLGFYPVVKSLDELFQLILWDDRATRSVMPSAAST